MAFAYPTSRIRTRGYGDDFVDSMERTEIYEDVNSMRIRTTHQDKEIAELKMELGKSKCAENNKIQDLIAYYYKK